MATKPDITVVDQDTGEVYLVEVAVPFDAFIDQCYQTKFDKYTPLCLEINKCDYACRIIVIIIGSLGTVHNKVTSGLKIIGLSNGTSNWLAKYMSTSACLGSYYAWRSRCDEVMP